MSFFKDFYKPAKKLFEDDYQKDSLSLTSKTKTNEGLALEASAKRKDTSVESYFKWTEKRKVKEYNVTVNGKLGSNGNTEGDVEIDLNNGLTVQLKGGLLAGEDSKELAVGEAEDKITRDTVGFEAKYSHKNFKGTFGGDFKRKNKPKFNVSGSTDYEGFTVGASAVVYSDAVSKPSTYSVGAGYATKDFAVLLLAENKLSSFKIGVRQDISKDLVGGVEFKHDLNTKKSNFSTGVSYKIDNEQTVKAKINESQKVQLAYNVNLNKDLKANIALETDLKALSGTASEAKVSLGFVYETK